MHAAYQPTTQKKLVHFGKKQNKKKTKNVTRNMNNAYIHETTKNCIHSAIGRRAYIRYFLHHHVNVTMIIPLPTVECEFIINGKFIVLPYAYLKCIYLYNIRAFWVVYCV